VNGLPRRVSGNVLIPAEQSLNEEASIAEVVVSIERRIVLAGVGNHNLTVKLR
jgi:hypothetical protein